MNCAESEIAICGYVDGTLAPAQKAELERHLAECPACAGVARDSAAAVARMISGSSTRASLVATRRPRSRRKSGKPSCASASDSNLEIAGCETRSRSAASVTTPQ